MKKLNLSDKIEKLSTPIQNIPSFIAFSKKKKLTKLRDQFDVAFKKLEENGKIAAIMKKYGVTL